jgi:RES domain-containing protein
MLVYRYVKEKYLNDPLSAEGAAKVGGRWNSEGTLMLYASKSASTAQLEILAGVNEYATLQRFRLVCIEIPDDIFYLTPVMLEGAQQEMGSELSWNADIRPDFTVIIGESWFAEQSTLAIGVPSSLSSNDYSILINTEHKDFDKVKIHTIDNERISQRLVITD